MERCLWLVGYSFDRGVAENSVAMRAFVAAGVAIAVSTEVLGALHLLRRGPLMVIWVLLLAWAAARVRPARPRLLWTPIFVIAAIAGFTALASPPNSVDAFGYHLARVVYWTQQHSVNFFATSYFNQVAMPPFAEYAMLHTYLLTGGDRLVNLVQWTGFIGSIVAVAKVARELGAGPRGQFFAALFCATLPNAILQASGAKNECVVALWLAATAYFALRREYAWMGAALGLALLTKGTAWLFAPPLLLAAMVPVPVRGRGLIGGMAIVLGLNAPQWGRNLAAFGNPVGPPSARADNRYRWTNARLTPAAAWSNLVRHTSQQLGARDAAWNQRIFGLAIALHGSIDPNDPATTWPGTHFAAPVNSNHEADAPNRWHLILLVVLLPLAWPVRRYLAALALALLLFCAVLRYQPFAARLLLPLFVLAAPVFGFAAERIRITALQVLLCLFLLDQTRHPLLHNWTRPLTGPDSILRTSRHSNYFRDMAQFGVTLQQYEDDAQHIVDAGCREVTVDNSRFELEYPFDIFVLERNAHVRFRHGQAAASDPCRWPTQF